MLFGDRLVVVRGGGDLGSGVVYQMVRAGFPTVVLELERPLAVRRAATFAPAAVTGQVKLEGIEAMRASDPATAAAAAASGAVAVLVSPDLPVFPRPIDALVDARMAKRNLGTAIGQAATVVALGPGFTAGIDCHAVVETMRGHRLGRVIWDGSAAPDTGVPGRIGGEDAGRVIRSPGSGAISWTIDIAATVEAGATIGSVDGRAVLAPLTGVVRGLILEGNPVEVGDKIGDVDPRGDVTACYEISDKARLVGSGALEAVLVRLGRS